MEKAFRVLLILTIISLFITVVFTVLAVVQSMDTPDSFNIDLERAEGAAAVCKTNGDMFGYYEAQRKIERIEAKWERELFVCDLLNIAAWVSGGVSVSLIVATSVVGVKLKNIKP